METFEGIKLATDVPGVGKAGDRVTLSMTPADVREASEIPTYVAGYKPMMYRADEASPVVLVDNDTDKYRTFSSDDAFRRVPVKGSIGGAVPEVDPSSSLATYKVIDRYVGSFIPKVTQGQNSTFQPVMVAARRCKRAIELDREIDVWTLLGTNTNFASNQRTALTSGYQWNDGSSSDPIKDLHGSIEASDQEVTDIWFNQKVANTFLRHDKVRDHMRQFIGAQAADGAIGDVAAAGQRSVDFSIPGMPPFHVVASKVKNETTSVIEYVLGNVVILLTRPPGIPSDGEEIATSYTYRRRGPSGTGFSAREFFLETRGAEGGTMIVVAQADEAVMTGNNCGGIITGVIQ